MCILIFILLYYNNRLTIGRKVFFSCHIHVCNIQITVLYKSCFNLDLGINNYLMASSCKMYCNACVCQNTWKEVRKKLEPHIRNGSNHHTRIRSCILFDPRVLVYGFKNHKTHSVISVASASPHKASLMKTF